MMLSDGGKEVLLISVSQSVSVYTLSLIVPPIFVIKDLHRIFAIFFGVTRKKEGAYAGKHGIRYFYPTRRRIRIQIYV